MTNAFRSSNCEKKKKRNHITIITINNKNILVTRPSKPNNYSIFRASPSFSYHEEHSRLWSFSIDLLQASFSNELLKINKEQK